MTCILSKPTLSWTYSALLCFFSWFHLHGIKTYVHPFYSNGQFIMYVSHWPPTEQGPTATPPLLPIMMQIVASNFVASRLPNKHQPTGTLLNVPMLTLEYSSLSTSLCWAWHSSSLIEHFLHLWVDIGLAQEQRCRVVTNHNNKRKMDQLLQTFYIKNVSIYW